MREINWNSIRSELTFILRLIFCRYRRKKVKGYRIISTEYSRYVAFADTPSPDGIHFVVDAEQAFIFRDQIEAFPYLLCLDCRFVFEPVIYKAF
ncbi:hypothetical protein CIW62_22175 [Enterobacter cloacae]|nr:hypothetical protein CIW62_22175 [Enterobacter cloacae]